MLSVFFVLVFRLWREIVKAQVLGRVCTRSRMIRLRRMGSTNRRVQVVRLCVIERFVLLPRMLRCGLGVCGFFVLCFWRRIGFDMYSLFFVFGGKVRN